MAASRQQGALIDQLQDSIADLRQRFDWAQSNIEAKDRQLADEKIRQLEATGSPQSAETSPQGLLGPQIDTVRQDATGVSPLHETQGDEVHGLIGWLHRLLVE